MRAVLLCLPVMVVLTGCKPPSVRSALDGKRLLDEGKPAEAIEKLKIATGSGSTLATNAQVWNYLGLAYHRAGQVTNAAQAYHRALLLDRDLVETRYNLGCLWLDENLPEMAKNELTAYTLRRGDMVDGWLKLGTAQLRLREATAAEKSFQEAQRVSAQNPEAFNGLGLVQIQRGRPREAAQYFSAALKKQPGYQPALLNLAMVLHQQLNDRAGALQRYREYLALRPKADDWDDVNALAQTLEPQSPTPPPIPPRQTVTNTIARGPIATNVVRQPLTNIVRATTPPKSNPPPNVTRHVPPVPAETKSNTTEVVKVTPAPAIKTATDVAPTAFVDTAPKPEPPPKTNPATAPAGEKRGFLNRIFGGDSKVPTTVLPGSAHTNDGSKPNPPVPAALQADAGDPGAGTSQRYKYLSPAKPKAGNRPQAERSFWQGQQAQRANRMNDAASAYQQSIQADPSYFEPYYYLGLAAYEARSYRQSLVAWEGALSIQPDSADTRYNFGLALKAAGYFTDAANELEKLLSQNPKEGRAHLVLGNLYAAQLGNPSRARTHYQKVLELDPRHPQATAIRYWMVAHPP